VGVRSPLARVLAAADPVGPPGHRATGGQRQHQAQGQHSAPDPPEPEPGPQVPAAGSRVQAADPLEPMVGRRRVAAAQPRRATGRTEVLGRLRPAERTRRAVRHRDQVAGQRVHVAPGQSAVLVQAGIGQRADTRRALLAMTSAAASPTGATRPVAPVVAIPRRDAEGQVGRRRMVPQARSERAGVRALPERSSRRDRRHVEMVLAGLHKRAPAGRTVRGHRAGKDRQLHRAGQPGHVR
jgi:hypothetical protein